MQDPSYFLTSKYVKELTPDDFDEIIEGDLVDERCAIVLFYADWCKYCKAVKDAYEAFAKTAAFIEVYAFNSAKYPAHINKIKEGKYPQLVRGYPTIIFYCGGRPSEQYQGDRTEEDLLEQSMRVCMSSEECKMDSARETPKVL